MLFRFHFSIFVFSCFFYSFVFHTKYVFFVLSQLLETFSSGVNTGEGLAEAAARVEGEEPQHDTAIYWFSCTHKRQVWCGAG